MKPYHVQVIPTELIDQPEEPLRRVDRNMVDDLQYSIEQDGLYHPIIVRPTAKGRFEVVAGLHRFVALKSANESSVPCVVRDVTFEEGQLINIAENIQRNDAIDPTKEGEIFAELCENGWTVETISKKIGRRDTRYVRHRIEVFQKIHPKLLKEVSDGKLTFIDAKAIINFKMSEQLRIAEKIKKTSALPMRERATCTHSCRQHCPVYRQKGLSP